MLQSTVTLSRTSKDMLTFRMYPNPLMSPAINVDPMPAAVSTLALDTQPQPIEIAARLFGRFSVTLNGNGVFQCNSCAGWSMLAYLLAHNRAAVPVDLLEDIFWPDADTHAARNNRNVAMSHLRMALRSSASQAVIEHRSGKYQFVEGCQLRTDVQEFEQHLNAGHWMESNHRSDEAINHYEAALSLYEDDFLVDELYQDWVLRKRDMLRTAYVDTLDRLSKLYFGRHNYAACIEASRRILSRDRWREDVHCLLMRCYIQQNQLCFAFKQYRDCVEALRQEFSMTPSVETVQLHAQMLRRDAV